MLRWSILCSLHTQYATRGAYCVGSVHMLFQWSSEDTQYALLENMSRGMFAFFSNCPLDIHLSILRTLYLKPCPHHNCIIVVFNPHQQYFGDVVSKFGFLPDMKVSNGAKIRNRYNQVPHLTQDTNGKVTNSQKTPQTRAKRSALSQQVTTKHI